MRCPDGRTSWISVMDEVLTYEVDQIKTVEPSETREIAIDPEQDYCTLLTCTPYGINSHRLLVRGRRVPTPVSETDNGSFGSYVIEAPEEVRSGLPLEEIMAGMGVLIILAAIGWWIARRKVSAQ